MNNNDRIKGLVPAVNRALLEAEEQARWKQAEEVLTRDLEQRNAELEAERARWQGVVEGIADEVWVCDLHGKMSLINLSTVTAMGLEAFQDKSIDEVLSMVEILNPDGQLRPPEEAPLFRSLQGEVVRGEEIMRHRQTGKVRYRQFSSAPTRDAYGAISGAVAIVRDITEYKQMERALQQANQQLAHINEDLERKVQERTAKLEETITELEHFSYTITHDMRAPLRALQGFSELMLRTGCQHCASEVSKQFLERIMTAAERMDALITDALQYSRAVTGELKLNPVHIAPLLRGMLESYPNLQPPNADVRLEGDFPLVLGNEAALTQCFSNLLGNAVKFVAPGVLPKVRVWAEAMPPQLSTPNSPSQLSTLNSQLVRIWFEDNGIGISNEYQDKIFGMFEQLNKGYEGTGIGLALVRKNALRMGGRVGLESEPGHGSRFWLELSLATTQA